MIPVLIFGAAGIFANCMIYQQKTRNKLILWKLISDGLWFLHYLFSHAYSGAAIALIGLFREFVFYKTKSEKARNLSLPGFLLVTVFSAILTWSGPTSLLPALASILSVVGFWKGEPRLSRMLAFPISGCMLAYDLQYRLYMGITNEVLILLATVFAIKKERWFHHKDRSR